MSGRHSIGENTRRRTVWRPIATAAVGGIVLTTMGLGIWASLSATATNAEPQVVTNGTLELAMAPNGTGFTQAVENLAPGDVANRYVQLTNAGTLDGQALTLRVTGTGATALTTDATRGLRVSVTDCVDGGWNAATGACTGTTSALLSDAPVSSLDTAATLVSGTVGAGEVHSLRVSVRLPDQNETTVNGAQPAGSIQGLSTNLTYTFAETQRTARTTNS